MAIRMLAVLVALAAGGPALADVTIKATGTGEGLGMSGTSSSTTYIKGLKMRIDGTLGKKATSTIFDVDNQKMIVLNDKKKEAEVWNMTAVSADVSNAVAVGGIKTTVKPNGQSKQVAGQGAEGYDLEIVVPATLGGPGGMAVTIVMTGTTWVVRGAPGTQDYSAFYAGAAEKGWIFTDPRAAKGQPGQARAMAQMYAEFAKLGGLPYESNTHIKLQGEGVMGGLMAKMGNVTMTSTVESVDAAPIADSLFLPPADYKLEEKN
jgi:hypothetical protein